MASVPHLPLVPEAARLTLPPIWREGALGLEVARLLRSGTWRGEGVPRSIDGDPVLLIPGFIAGDGSLALMTNWLRRMGYHTKSAGIRVNIDCSADLCRALEQRLEQLVDKRGTRVAIIGQSRGGVIAKALGSMRPDLVSGVVALGSPICGQLHIHPLVLAQVGLLATLGSAGRRGLMRHACLTGECCRAFREAIEGPLPDDVGYVSIYSRQDGIVDWRACLDPAADAQIEVRGSHCGMAVNPTVYQHIGRSLAAYSADASGFADAA